MLWFSNKTEIICNVKHVKACIYVNHGDQDNTRIPSSHRSETEIATSCSYSAHLIRLHQSLKCRIFKKNRIMDNVQNCASYKCCTWKRITSTINAANFTKLRVCYLISEKLQWLVHIRTSNTLTRCCLHPYS